MLTPEELRERASHRPFSPEDRAMMEDAVRRLAEVETELATLKVASENKPWFNSMELIVAGYLLFIAIFMGIFIWFMVRA